MISGTTGGAGFIKTLLWIEVDRPSITPSRLIRLSAIPAWHLRVRPLSRLSGAGGDGIDQARAWSIRPSPQGILDESLAPLGELDQFIAFLPSAFADNRLQ